MKKLLQNTSALANELQIADELLDPTSSFPLRVPARWVAKMRKGDMNDPLLKQIAPLLIEREEIKGFSKDPLHEKQKNPIPGLIHKYQGRALLIVTGACAIHCRYCFRRAFPYEDNNPGRKGWNLALDYLRRDTSIKEIILSGGDPLSATDALLDYLITRLAEISHIKTIRLHSRTATVLPERITSNLIAILTKSKRRIILVTHVNHPHELDHEVRQTMDRLREASVTLLNQSVLLRDINDNAATLVTLSEQLFDHGILPYYLHLLDKVEGSAHFDVTLKKARTLISTLQEQLPGYLVPKLVKEEAGALSKLSMENPYDCIRE